MLSNFEIFILALVEGLTEFLPVSSTGHLIVVSHFLTTADPEFMKAFNIVIQFGAILSVIAFYPKQFLDFSERNRLFFLKLLVAFIPAAFLGLLFKSKLNELLDSINTVAIMLILGGVALLYLELWLKRNPRPSQTIEGLTIKDCLVIGAFQCLALIPGVSRSAATIFGSLYKGLSFKESAEFSFFLAVPTLTAASMVKLKDALPYLNDLENVKAMLLGIALSFVFASIAIKAFIKLVSVVGFRPFAIYRIVLGSILIFFFWT